MPDLWSADVLHFDFGGAETIHDGAGAKVGSWDYQSDGWTLSDNAAYIVLKCNFRRLDRRHYEWVMQESRVLEREPAPSEATLTREERDYAIDGVPIAFERRRLLNHLRPLEHWVVYAREDSQPLAAIRPVRERGWRCIFRAWRFAVTFHRDLAPMLRGLICFSAYLHCMSLHDASD